MTFGHLLGETILLIKQFVAGQENSAKYNQTAK